MKSKIIYNTLLALTVVILVLPAVQQHTKWFKLKPLHGVTVATVRPKLSVKSFMTGEYQRQEEQYLAENIGFRELLVRCYNQVSWSLFRLPQNKRVFVGSHAVIMNKRRLGDDAYVCAGSIVFNNVKSGVKVFGNPAKVFDL